MNRCPMCGSEQPDDMMTYTDDGTLACSPCEKRVSIAAAEERGRVLQFQSAIASIILGVLLAAGGIFLMLEVGGSGRRAGRTYGPIFVGAGLLIFGGIAAANNASQRNPKRLTRE